MKILIVITAALSSIGCAVPNKPNIDLINKERAFTKAHVVFEVNESVSRIVEKIKLTAQKCINPKTSSSSIVPVAGGFVPVVTSQDWYVIDSVEPNGSQLVALRMNARWMQAVPIGVEVFPVNSEKSKVVVFRANKKKREIIKQRVEDGTILCQWRDVSYPWD